MNLGFKRIYPDVNIDAAGSAGQYVGQDKVKPEDNKQTESQEQQEFKVSAFSSYDSNQDSAVTSSSEAPSSIFTQKDITSNTSSLFGSNVTTQQREQILSQTNSAFDATGQFNSMVNNFSQNVSTSSRTFNTQSEAENFQRSESARLDNEVQAAAKQFSTKINDDLYAAYSSQINKATDDILAKQADFDGTTKDIKQGDVEDCWILSDVKSLSETEFGRQALADAVDSNHAGTPEDPYILTIYDSEGNKKTISVTNDDLAGYGNSGKKYSEGDPNINIIEAGLNNYFKEEISAGRLQGRDINDPLNGSPFGKYSATYMLTGQLQHGLTTVDIQSENADFYKAMTNENMQNVLNQFADNPNNMSMTCAFIDKNNAKTGSVDAQISNHRYYITGITRNADGSIDTISYKNPWDTSKTYTMPFSEFKDNVAQIDYLQNK